MSSTSSQDQVILAPGARVLIRDEEWLVRRVDRTPNGHQALSVTGISELVRDKNFVFLTELDEYETLDPKNTILVDDDSSGYVKSRLHIESLLRRTPPTTPDIYLGHRAAMDSVPYQLVPALMALDQPRPRILIADAVGLGKTLEAGILMSELIRRGRGKRILVVTLKSMLTQFQKELWSRFTIPLVRLDSVGIQRVRKNIPSNHNPFYSFDKSIISIDTLKAAREYQTYIENAYWDIIVIDEAQNVADRGTGSLRSKLAKLLKDKSDTLIMLSATPHDGRARSFASLVNMLDPTAIADANKYTKAELKGKNLFVRRFKRDIQQQVKDHFPEPVTRQVVTTASPEEEVAFDTLVNTPAEVLTRKRSGSALFRTVLEKALFSSPAACRETIGKRLRNLEKEDDQADNIHALRLIDESLAQITPSSYSKYQMLLDVVKEMNWDGKTSNDRLVIFTERIATLKFLHEQLAQDLKLKAGAIQELYGEMGDIDQQRIVEEFGRGDSQVRLLIASDVASEGINLHFQCHRLIHFDVPWSLMTLQQRNGRIDRYGQLETPQITYLLTNSENEEVKGDVRIVQLLIEKQNQALANIGDPAAIIGVYDAQEEERIVSEAIEQGMSRDEALKHLQKGAIKTDDDKPFDPLAALQGNVPKMDDAITRIKELPTLFGSEYNYLKTALQHLTPEAQQTPDDDRKVVSLVAPPDLKNRFKMIPKEARPKNDTFVLAESPGAMMREFERCRAEDETWPKIQYLWPLHPVMDWISDKAAMSFRRQEAPIIAIPSKLAEDEAIFVISALIPNRKGHPVVHRWFSVQFSGDGVQEVEDFEETIARLDLSSANLANAGTAGNRKHAQKLLPEAVEWAREWMSDRHKEFMADVKPQLDRHLTELDQLKAQHIFQLDLGLDSSRDSEDTKDRKRNEGKREINNLFNVYVTWIKETMETENKPYIQVVAALVHD